MKRLFLTAGLLLSGCVTTLSEQQAMVMPAGDLCTYEINFGYSEVANNAIHARNINCEKVILAESKTVIPTLGPVELCAASNRNSIPAVYPLIQKEIKKRNLDCASFMQSQQELAIPQHPNFVGVSSERAVYIKQPEPSYQRPTTTECRPALGGGFVCTTQERPGADHQMLRRGTKSMSDYMREGQ